MGLLFLFLFCFIGFTLYSTIFISNIQFFFLSRSLLGQKILGYPVRIDNKLYARNAFYFNFCFVFAPTTRTVVFEPVVRKLTEYMVSCIYFRSFRSGILFYCMLGLFVGSALCWLAMMH